MDKSISDQLDAILDSHAKKVEDLAKAVTAQKEIEQDFLRAYSEHRDQVIEPALKEAAEYIENRGMKTSIERKSQGRGSAAISLNLLIGDKTRSAVPLWPHLTFVANKDEKLVVIYENTIGPTAAVIPETSARSSWTNSRQPISIRRWWRCCGKSSHKGGVLGPDARRWRVPRFQSRFNPQIFRVAG